ncbi:MAG: hypothetical protein RLY84_218 [Actinomycetota bacterium]|jgi:hypothetical protein
MKFTDLLVILLFVGPAIVTIGLIAWLVWSLQHHRSDSKGAASQSAHTSADQPQGHETDDNER